MSAGRSIKEEYKIISQILVLMADELEPKAFLQMELAKLAMRRPVVLEEAARKKSSTSVEKELSKHVEFVGTGSGLSEKTRSLPK